MARGKYGASAAKRRAETAEAQLDRLLPKLVDAERTAKRYKAEAERVPVLWHQLKELKDAVGMPVDEHTAQLAAINEERDLVLDAYDEAMKLVFDTLVDAGAFVEDPGETKHISVDMLGALYVIPSHVTEKLLQRLGWWRDMRRWAPTPAAMTKLHESLRGRRTRHPGLTEVDGELGQRMVKFLSKRADDRASERAVSRADEMAEERSAS